SSVRPPTPVLFALFLAFRRAFLLQRHLRLFFGLALLVFRFSHFPLLSCATRRSTSVARRTTRRTRPQPASRSLRCSAGTAAPNAPSRSRQSSSRPSPRPRIA